MGENLQVMADPLIIINISVNPNLYLSPAERDQAGFAFWGGGLHHVSLCVTICPSVCLHMMDPV